MSTQEDSFIRSMVPGILVVAGLFGFFLETVAPQARAAGEWVWKVAVMLLLADIGTQLRALRK